jgi:transposase-like protein
MASGEPQSLSHCAQKAGEWSYLWRDATDLTAQQNGRIVSVAAIIAVAASTDGRREIIGLGVAFLEPRPSGGLLARSSQPWGLRN